MTTRVTITGTGAPPVVPGRAGAERQQYLDDIRAGGFDGDVRVCDDLDVAEL